MTARHFAAVAVAAAGLAVAGYLACYQLDWFGHPWDPVFGAASSTAVLHSSLAEALPVPDAGLGAAAYAVEVLLGLAVAARPTRRGLILTYGIVAAAAAAASLALVAVQALVVHHWCLLCLTSAAASWVVAALVVPDAIHELTDTETSSPRHASASVARGRT